MVENLDTVIQIVEEIRNTTSSNDKVSILSRNKDNEMLQKILVYTYDKNKKFGVTKKSIKLYNGESKWSSLFEMLDELEKSNINNNLKINIGKFMGSLKNEKEFDLVLKVLTKDLKCGISLKTINKAMDNLIFDFQVMKASSYDEKNKGTFNNKARKQGYMMMIKENGERGIVIKEKGKVIVKSRQDKLFEGLYDLENAFTSMPDNMVYEGELLAFEPNRQMWVTSEDQFKLTNKILHTDGIKKGIYISLFDMIPLEDFKQGKCEIKAEDRKLRLKEFVENNNKEEVQFAEIIYKGKDVDLIEKELERVSKNSYKEGLMVILNDSIYESKRVKHILKCKLWHTADLKVIKLKESVERPNSLGSLVVDYKGEEQGVSGITDELKELWWNNPNEIIGKIIEVKYKAITKDSEGKESLQFCGFIRVREDKTEDDISYE